MKLPWRRSIFFRLLLIYSCTFFAVIGGLFAIFSASNFRGETVRRNINHYSSLLADEIGLPPNIDLAARLHGELGLNIAISGPDLLWASRPDFMERINELRSDDRAFRRLWPGPFLHGRGIARIERPPYTFYFSGARTEGEFSVLLLLLALGYVALVLFGSYRLVRRSLRPLRAMEEATRAFGEGRWRTRIPVRGHDELSALAQSINEMADRIVGYIESMQNLLVAISHELRSPLTRMKVALEFVQNESIRNSLNEDITILDRMTESLLERERLRERPNSLQRERIVWNDFLSGLAAAYPKLQVDLADKKIGGDIDKHRMGIAVRNLIENAFKHSGGAPVSLRLSRRDSQALIEVEDGGPGIPEKYWDKLGEPFFMLDKARGHHGGFGLGLSLVFAIVKAHDGQIEIARSETGGMLFRIVL